MTLTFERTPSTNERGMKRVDATWQWASNKFDSDTAGLLRRGRACDGRSRHDDELLDRTNPRKCLLELLDGQRIELEEPADDDHERHRVEPELFERRRALQPRAAPGRNRVRDERQHFFVDIRRGH